MKKSTNYLCLLFFFLTPLNSLGATKNISITWTITETSDVQGYKMYYAYDSIMSNKMLACETSDTAATTLTCANINLEQSPVYFVIAALSANAESNSTAISKTFASGISKVQGFILELTAPPSPPPSTVTINLWDNAHQDPAIQEIYSLGELNYSDGAWDELHYPERPFPTIFAGINEWENNSLQPQHFFMTSIPNGTYEVWANLYIGYQTKHYYGYTIEEVNSNARWVDNVIDDPNGTNRHNEYLLGDININNGRFDIWIGDADNNTSSGSYGWSWIRLSSK